MAFFQAFSEGRLSAYVETAGGGDRFLHFGSKVTPELSFNLRFGGDESGEQIRFIPTADEDFRYLGEIPDMAFDRESPWRIFHVHDTSSSSPMRRRCKLDDNAYLRPDGGNLPAILYHLRLMHASAYDLIRRTVQLAAPFFSDFQLRPMGNDPDSIKLEWRHKGSDQYFDATSLSDGTLRFIALATYFLQPTELRPQLILVDEPELGLHPHAIQLLASLIKQAAVSSQVIVTTQSPLLLDHFQPEDTLVADRVDHATQIRRLDTAPLASWLEDYSLGQLWKKMKSAAVRALNSRMSRLIVHVEGQTEESFVNELLAPHLYARGFHAVSARQIGNPRRQGGICGWLEAKKGILNHLWQDAGVVVTTMVDYYGLPQDGGREWPGRAAARLEPANSRASFVESKLSEDLRTILDTNRFIPVVVMHEFEALLFSDCVAFGKGIYRPEVSREMLSIREQFGNPEEINDSPETAPSKRILGLYPGYQKPIMGSLGAMAIGLDRIRAECPHFDGWVRRLETIV